MNVDELAQLVRRVAQPHPAAVPPGGELKPRQRVDRHRVGRDAVDVAEGDLAALSSGARTRASHSPGRSARAIGPRIAKAIVRGAEAVIKNRTELRARTHRAREPGLDGALHGLEVGPQAVVAVQPATTDRVGPGGGMPNWSRSPWTTSTGTVTASSSDRRLGAGELPERRGGCSGKARQSTPAAPVAAGRAARDARARGAASGDERQAVQLAVGQVLDDGRPGRIELLRRSRRAAACNAIGLLHERDGEPLRLSSLRRGHEVRRRHAAAGAVTEDERAARPLDGVQMHVRRAVRRLDCERGHARTISTAPPASSCRTGRGSRRRCRTAAPSAPARTRRRDP